MNQALIPCVAGTVCVGTTTVNVIQDILAHQRRPPACFYVPPREAKTGFTVG
jgi:hypothetical protein